jgi:hypothetical protein
MSNSKLNKKQQEIKAKILAGTHVLKNDVNAEKAVEVLNNIKYSDKWSGTNTYYGVTKDFCFAPIIGSEIKHRPIINMSEWFEESEETSESTKDFQGSREYDDVLLSDYNCLLMLNELIEDGKLIKCRKEFISKRYQNESLLKEKAELEQRLKEIESKLSNG